MTQPIARNLFASLTAILAALTAGPAVDAAVPRTGGSAAAATARPHHYLVVRFDREGGVETLFHRIVDLVPDPGGPAGLQPDAASRVARGEAVAVSLLTGDEEVVHRGFLDAERELRGEFHGEARPGGGWAIDAHRFPVEDGVFAVRVPRVPGASLRLEWGASLATLDLDLVENRAATLPLNAAGPPAAEVALLAATGSPANRVDLLVMGDGYTSAVDFNADAAALLGAFLGISPYDGYVDHLNLVTAFVASAEDGADHPPYDPSCPAGDLSCCADLEASVDPLAGTYVDTAFDGRYCAQNVHRLAVVDVAKVLAAASGFPGWDEILVVLNDDTYGGSGGFLSVGSTHPLSVDVVRHEYGHSFTGLADEYDLPFPGFPICSDIVGPPCEPNVTDQTAPALIKWEPWIDPGTPIPTPEGDPDHADDVGLFEGARYRATGMYRPRDAACLMHSLGQSFGEICEQTYVLRLYAGGWGVPSGGIDPIEPGSESPSPGFVNLAPPATLDLSAALVEPSAGPALDVTWWVEGVLQGAAGPSLHFDPPSEGLYRIELRVADPTPLVHPGMAGDALESRRAWTVGVGDYVFADGFESGDVSAWSASEP